MTHFIRVIIVLMITFSNSKTDSSEKFNSDFLIQTTVQKFFNQNNFVLIEKNLQNANLQYHPEVDSQNGPIYVQISYNHTCKVSFRYRPQKPLNQQTIMKKINEINANEKETHSKLFFDPTSNALLCTTILKRSEVHENCFVQVESQLSSTFSLFQKLIFMINDQTSNQSFNKSDINQSPALKKIKQTIEKLKWFMIKKIIDKNNACFLFSPQSMEKCSLNFQLKNLSEESQLKYSEKQVQKIYQQLNKDQQKKKKQRKDQSAILSGIKLNKIEEVNELISQSKFSQLKLLKALYQIEKTSINKKVIEEIGRQLGEQKQGILVSKYPKQYGKRSFNVQMTILRHIRMESCPNISSFYVQQLLSPTDQPQCLYSNYYEGNIGSGSLSIKKKFRLIESLANGLQFLQGMKIIHRDLKPQNILYTSDPALCCKIIDFGSAHPLQKYVQSKLQLNQPLSTTMKYNLFQENTPLAVQALYTPTQFQQHENYDMYAFGVMMEEFFSNSSSKQTFGEFVWLNLMWIKDHLKNYDPNKRLNPVYISILIKLLLKFFISSLKISS